MKIKVFFSRGGELSKQVAKAVYDWLPFCYPNVVDNLCEMEIRRLAKLR